MAEEISAKDLVKDFMDTLNKGYQNNKENSVIKVLDRTVKSLETVLKALDKFLKSKNIDVGKAYNYSKGKTKSLFEQAQRSYGEVKTKGFKNTVTDSVAKIKNKFDGFTESDTGPPEERKTPGLFGKLKNSVTKVTKGLFNAQDESDDDRLDEASMKSIARKQRRELIKQNGRKKLTNTRRQEINDEKAKVQEALKQKEENKKGWLGKAVSAATAAKDITTSLVTNKDDAGNTTVDIEKKEEWQKKADEREEKRNKEIEAEKAAVKEKANKPKKDGWLGKILKGIGMLGLFVTKGLFKAVNFLGGMLLKGIGKSLFRLVPWLSGGIARAVSGLITTAVSKVAGLAWRGVKAVGQAAGTGLKNAALSLGSKVGNFVSTSILPKVQSLGSSVLKGARSLLPKVANAATTAKNAILPAASAVAKSGFFAGAKNAVMGVGGKLLTSAALKTVGTVAAGIFTGPVGWAILAASYAYDGYRLYKYLTRNSVSENIYGKLTLLRLYTYGFNDLFKDYYYKIFDLEMLLKDHAMFVDGKVVIQKFDDKTIKKIEELFGISAEDKDQYELFQKWFKDRFGPAYKAFLQALWSINDKIYLDNIDQIKQKDLEEFIALYRLPVDAFKFNLSPIKDLSSAKLATNEEIDVLYKNITGFIRNNSPGQKTPVEQAAKENKEIDVKDQNKANEDAKNAAKEFRRQQNKEAMLKMQQDAARLQADPNAVTSTSVNGNQITQTFSDPLQEGENEPKLPSASAQPASMGQMANAATDKLKTAQGPLVPGSASLEGISSKLDKSKILGIDGNMLQLFTGMAKEYHSLTGKKIPVGEALRSRADQQRLYDQKKGVGVARPGNSLHEFGIALDTGTVVNAELEKLGLLRKYGFTRPVGGEKWHLEPIGVSLDPKRAKTDMAFRTQAILNSPGRGGMGYGVVTPDKPKGNRNVEMQKKIFNQPRSEAAEPPKTAENDANVLTGQTPPPSDQSVTQPQNQPSIISTGPTSVIPEAKENNTFNFGDVTNTPGITDTLNSIAGNVTKGPDSTNTNIPGFSSMIDPLQEGENEPKIPSQESLVRKNASVDAMFASSPSVDTSLTGQSNPISLTPPSSEVPGLGPNMNLSTVNPNLDPIAAIQQASKMTGVKQETLLSTAKIESSLNPKAKAKTSSASGLYQIINSTWRYLVKKYGKKYGITYSSDRFNPLNNALMGAEYIKENLKGIQTFVSKGIPEDTAAYIAHFLGPGGAKRFFNALFKNPNAPSYTSASESAVKANRSIFGGRTVKGVLDLMENKIAKARGTSVTKYNPQLPEPKSNPTEGVAGEAAASSPMASIGSTSAYSQQINNLPTLDSPSVQNAFMGSTTPSTPSISNSQMDMFNSTPSAPDPGMSAMSQTSAFDTGNMESILSQQLTVLNTIAESIGKLSGNFDMGKLGEVISGSIPSNINNAVQGVQSAVDTAQSTASNVISSVKNTATSVVDLTRKSLKI